MGVAPQRSCMSEEEKSVNTEDVATPQTSNDTQVSPPAQESSHESAKDSKEYNFARLREEKEKLEQELKKYREEQANKNQVQDKDELDELEEDDILTVSQAKKLAMKQAQQFYKQAQAEEEKRRLPEVAKSRYKDFEEVLTKENIEKFEKLEPELATACMNANNPWEASYKMIKMMIVDKEKPQEKKQEIQSSAVVGKRASLTQAGKMGKMDRQQLYKEMLAASRGRSI